METKCSVCGEPMPQGEEMFKYHGYSGPCPKPPLNRPVPDPIAGVVERVREIEKLWGAGNASSLEVKFVMDSILVLLAEVERLTTANKVYETVIRGHIEERDRLKEKKTGLSNAYDERLRRFYAMESERDALGKRVEELGDELAGVRKHRDRLITLTHREALTDAFGREPTEHNV